MLTPLRPYRSDAWLGRFSLGLVAMSVGILVTATLYKADFGNESIGAQNTVVVDNLTVNTTALANGTLQVNGNFTEAGPITSTATITPPALAAQTNNYNPTGLASASYILQDASSSQNLTGLAAQTNGREIILRNISSTNTITLTNQDPASLAINQFLLPNGKSWAVGPLNSIHLRYSATDNKWEPRTTVNSNGTFGTLGVKGDVGFCPDGSTTCVNQTGSWQWLSTYGQEDQNIVSEPDNATFRAFENHVVILNPTMTASQQLNQTLLHGTADTTASVLSTWAGEFGVDVTRTAGANNLINTALLIHAAGAQVNYAIDSVNGDWLQENASRTFNNAGSAIVGGTSQFNGAVTVNTGVNVTLGTQVQQFTMNNGVQPQINIGDPANNQIINIRNTGGVQRFVGIDLQADTTRNASALPIVSFRRAAGGNTVQGLIEVTDGSVYSSANDMVVGTATAQALTFISNNTVGMKLNSTGNIEFGGNSGTKQICAIGTTAPTVNHGTLSGDSNDCAGRITAIGANSSFTLTFGGTTNFTAIAHCFMQPISGTGKLNVYLSTVSSSAPVFSCADTTTGAAANCPDVDYLCWGH